MKTATLTAETVKQQLSDILLDISRAKTAQKYFGKSGSWMYHKLDGVDGNGNKSDTSSNLISQISQMISNVL